MDKLSTKLKALGQWLWLRKKTTPAHWGVGALCAALSALFFPAGWLLLGVFAGDEIWNDKCEGTREGNHDWWEAFLVFCIGLVVLVILQFCGKISIKWY